MTIPTVTGAFVLAKAVLGDCSRVAGSCSHDWCTKLLIMRGTTDS